MTQSATAGTDGMELVACHDCDTLQRVPALAPGGAARCQCCNTTLLRSPKGGLDRSIALHTAALILLVLANAFPFLTLDISGRQEVTTLMGASIGLYQAGMGELAVVVLITSVLGPALLIASGVISSGVFGGCNVFFQVRAILAWISYLQPWGMLDVFMLGVLVSFVKLAGMATMHLGTSMYAFVGLIMVSAAATASFEPHILWHRLGTPSGGKHAGQ